MLALNREMENMVSKMNGLNSKVLKLGDTTRSVSQGSMLRSIALNVQMQQQSNAMMINSNHMNGV